MTTRLLYGDLRTGRIFGELDATAASWAQILNDAGSVDSVTVPGPVVRDLNLRVTAQAGRTFLAVEQDERIQEAGPVWSRPWDWKSQTLTLGASGLWSLFDHRKVIPVLAAGQKVQQATTKVVNTDLGGIARALVVQALTHAGGDLPIVLPAAAAGTRTEEFPGWKLLWLGDQLRELTQREAAAPDIRFRPRRQADPRFIEWVMETGTEAVPRLTQVGNDWTFDTTAPRSPVEGISTDENGGDMGERGWVTGNGSEQDMLIATAYDPTLVAAGWPLLEQEENRSTVEVQATLDGHAAALVARSARPVEVWKVDVRADYAREVRAGDYCQVTVAGDAWLPDGSYRLRVAKKSGSLGGTVTLDCYPLVGQVYL